MSASYRDAGEADLPAIVALLADDMLGAGREDTTLPLADSYVAAFRAIATSSSQRLLVALEGETVVGTMQLSILAGLSRRGSWHGLIEAVRIAQHLRGSGRGEAFVRWAVEQCRTSGCASVDLVSDNRRPAAHRFWRRLGFEPTHMGFKRAL